MAHLLVIESLHDGRAHCICGGWSFVTTGKVSREYIEQQFSFHDVPETDSEPYRGTVFNRQGDPVTVAVPNREDDVTDDSLTQAETATILCALRNFQENPEPHGLDPKDVLTSQQIDELCETISTQGLVTFRRS